MPAPAPKPDQWSAYENKRGKQGVGLFVCGKVEMADASRTPHLAEAAPQGKNPKILVLTLSVDGRGGGKARVWKHAHYDKETKRDQYASVDVHWQGKSIAA